MKNFKNGDRVIDVVEKRIGTIIEKLEISENRYSVMFDDNIYSPHSRFAKDLKKSK